ncbi:MULTISPECIES: hypothetical protein [unclassified Shewanella]|uniref:hypothetical protein n=2 Tax=Shewanellaceae TaxID=267890 RepID=UPI0011C028DE|nr:MULTISPECIES: hypothetical protein [unclassified Shewanella]MCK7633675.1 hypothetical protein [Shewanella sp. JNE17]MCK7648942.1 hypothetical protein [Shewanella sp. JNE8]UPO32648.1 hypothetical protein MZ182_07385 [Shewanella sp. JNE2]
MMTLTQLTFIGFYLNGAQGSGRYDSISITDIKTELEKGTLFPYLEKQLGQDIDTSIFSEEEKAALNAEWLEISLVTNEKRKMCVEKGGLCLLVAYVLESIQILNRKASR